MEYTVIRDQQLPFLRIFKTFFLQQLVTYLAQMNGFLVKVVFKLLDNVTYWPPTQGTRTSGRRYQGITLTVDGLNWVTLAGSRSYLPTPPLGQDMTQGQFLSGVWQVWIQSFPSPRLVASPRLKNLVAGSWCVSNNDITWYDRKFVVWSQLVGVC